MNIKDIYWIAGILEGEGHFGLSHSENYPRISLTMTDEDIVSRVKDIMSPRTLIHRHHRNPLDWKPIYELRINSHYAVGWMMTLYSIMSARRKEQIQDTLSSWRKSNSRHFSKAIGDNLLRVLARKHCLPKAVVRLRLMQGRYTTDPISGRVYLG